MKGGNSMDQKKIGSVYERVAGAGLGLDCGMLIVLAMYLSGLLGKIKARREMKRKYNCK